ncbi:helix-turn-helix domain-containing protein [Rhodococcus rhodochrous]|uniref:helix-turn-helix domain-containing protein n=1 Tax=Rhodococcus rhodochrous TaxID=1829 RepID=UPI003558EEE1
MRRSRPLSPSPAVREVSFPYLPEVERIHVADLRPAGVSVAKIAEQLHRARSTIYREVTRNRLRPGCIGRRRPRGRLLPGRARQQRCGVHVHPELAEAISELLAPHRR